ncbi:unnamed protein product [Effrenium voratum]|nr:unnamed protein product [Effrenium voratum]
MLLGKCSKAEGFVRWRVRDDDDLDEALAGHAELVKEAEAGRLPEDGDAPAKRRRLEAPQALELHSRAARGHFLRVLRRQVEFYFSETRDSNLKRDWFFQEKIASEPEPGWLELCYIMPRPQRRILTPDLAGSSCPRVRDVHRASEQDVLDALASSSLKVKEVDGRHWLARPQPLPRLEIARPGRPNSELLHDSVDREEDYTEAPQEESRPDASSGSPEASCRVRREVDRALERQGQDPGDGESDTSQEDLGVAGGFRQGMAALGFSYRLAAQEAAADPYM